MAGYWKESDFRGLRVRKDGQPKIKLEMIFAKTKKIGDCIEWQGSYMLPSPYPRIYYKGKCWRGNRLVYTLANGPIKTGMVIMHTCDNPRCVNPAHLREGTLKENSQDSADKGRSTNSRKTHCIHGHAFAGKNVLIGALGRRYCRSCTKYRLTGLPIPKEIHRDFR